MHLANEFVIGAGASQAWELLNDLERVAPCLPGAVITGREDDRYLGTVKVKVGPIGANLQGTARFADADESAGTAVLVMAGKDPKGGTSTDATMRVRLEPIDAGSTRVFLDTDLEISGRMAQFGRGAIADVSNRLIGQFTANLAALVEAPEASATPIAGGVGGPADQRAAASPNAAGLDVVSLIAPQVARTLLPFLAGAVVGFALGRLTRRSRGFVPAYDPVTEARILALLDARGVR